MCWFKFRFFWLLEINIIYLHPLHFTLFTTSINYPEKQLYNNALGSGILGYSICFIIILACLFSPNRKNII